MPRGRASTMNDFWASIDKTDDCWNWTGIVDAVGYGRFNIDYQAWRAHRFAYELLVGPIPDGLVIDHLCRNRRCVNPEHLEAVTDQVNILRGTGTSAVHAAQTACVNGHPFDEANTIYRKYSGERRWRTCRACLRARNLAREAAQRAARVAS